MRKSFLTNKQINLLIGSHWIIQIIAALLFIGGSIFLFLQKDSALNIVAYPLLAMGIIFIIIAVSQIISNEQRKRQLEEYNKLLFQSNIEDIDNMNGKQFEDYLGVLYSKLGYNTKVTRYTGDYGADLVLEKNNEKIVIQAKCYRKTVPLTAIQQIVSAKQYYNANSAWVVTNNYFSQPAKNLAQANNVLLIDRVKLMETIVEAKSIQQKLKA